MNVGDEHINKHGIKFTILEYVNYDNVFVMFHDTGYINSYRKCHIESGKIKNPYSKRVLNIGCLGIPKYANKVYDRKAYNCWLNMLTRCYSKYYHTRHPTYVDCLVDDYWLCFEYFYEWYIKNYIEGYELDKDILYKGNKIYSEHTSCFVPKEINMLINTAKGIRGKHSIGVHFRKDKNKYSARVNLMDGSIRHLGYFNSNEEAFFAYKLAKEEIIKKTAIQYKKLGKINQKIYNSLMSYKVSIDD